MTTRKPTRMTQMMICTQSGTPRRGAGMDVSVMNSLICINLAKVEAFGFASGHARARSLIRGLFLLLEFFFQAGDVWILVRLGFCFHGRSLRHGGLHPHLEAAEEQECTQKNAN